MWLRIGRVCDAGACMRVCSMLAEIKGRTGHGDRDTGRECATCRNMRQTIVINFWRLSVYHLKDHWLMTMLEKSKMLQRDNFLAGKV